MAGKQIVLLTPRDSVETLFRAVDSQNWDLLNQVFHPEIVYERPGYPRFQGIERVLHFYRYERILAGGRHSMVAIVINSPFGACWGRFVGQQKNGTDVDELFSDSYVFDSSLIIARRSYFFRPAI